MGIGDWGLGIGIGDWGLGIGESASIQTFPEDFEFIGAMNSCYRQIGNAVPVRFSEFLGREFMRIEREHLV